MGRDDAPPPPTMGRRLARVAEALEQDDPAGALAIAESAANEFPTRVEPLEMAMLCHLRAEDSRGVAGVIERIAKVDPASPFVRALQGLRTAAEGDSARCLGELSWFVGRDALPRRGRMVPLFAAPGELEEQAAFAALRLGHAQAGLDALDAAIAARAGDARRTALLGLLRGDALWMLGRTDEARECLARSAAFDAPSGPVAGLSALRLDAMGEEGARTLSEAMSRLEDDPSDDFALWRVMALAANAQPDHRTALRSQVDRTGGGLRGVRRALVAAALDPGRRTQLLDDALLDVSDAGAPVDRVALVLAFRHIARVQRDRLLPLAAYIADWRPNDLDAVANALLASGVALDALLEDLEAGGPRPAAEALRSRILARHGFAEDSYAVAEDARGRWPGSKALRVAVALASVDLGDATLLGRIDEVARRDDGSTDRTMAMAWFAIQEMPIARIRSMAAAGFDARDRSAALCAALSSLEIPAERAAAAESVRMLASAPDALGAEAWSMRGEVAASSERSAEIVASWPVCANAVARFRVLAADCESMRIPLAGECLALVEEIEPSPRSMQSLARIESGALVPPRWRAWMSTVHAEAPALPERRRLARRAEPVAPSAIPARPLVARYDAMCAAPPDVLRAERDRMRRLRPVTPTSESIEIAELAAAGRLQPAEDGIAVLLRSDGERIPALAARRVLAAMVVLAKSDRDRAERLQAALAALVARMDRIAPADMLEANRVFMAIEHGPSETEAFERSLADRARPMLAGEADACIETIGGVALLGDDPFAASKLAAALASQSRLCLEVRARLSTAAVGLAIGAGDGADEIAGLVEALAGEGAPPWSPSAAEAQASPVARGLLRASEVFGLLGSEGESRRLLEAALRLVAERTPESETAADQAVLSETLNGLAYADLARGVVTDETVARAEQAARLRPDDPATLDTIGFLRYHQGRFRDDAQGTGAVSLYRQALRLRPNSPSLETVDHLGDALWRSGDQEGAVKSWQQIGLLARKRYPPELFATRMRAFQLRNFGFELVPAPQFVRREYGEVVARAQRKLEQVARGEPPSVADCKATR